MLAKSACVVINALAFMRGVQPPAAAAADMTDAEKKKNRDKFKGSEAEVVEAAFTNILLGYVVIALLALSYLWWMYRGSISPNLTLWHPSLSIVGTLGCLLRIWSFNELGRFFTYIVKILPGHHLIKTGPYKYLIHPSYTGIVLSALSFYGALSDGYWPLFKTLLPFTVPGWVVAALGSCLVLRMFTTRAKNEEAVMAAHFGAEWDEYVSARWRFVPFLY
ncbi:hypothetical protein CPB97_006845 [Podila verticillata]|nr:hypothetical protein CPB97_006845 [Podila verticillata]